MGNCHFQTDFDAENITGKLYSIMNCLSRQQVIVPIHLLHRQGRVRKGVEGQPEEDQARVRHEGDEQGQDTHQAQCQISHERATDPHPAPVPLPCQHVLRLPGPGEPLPGDGSAQRGRHEVPHLSLSPIR